MSEEGLFNKSVEKMLIVNSFSVIMKGAGYRVKRTFGFKLVVVFVLTMFIVSTGIGLYALSSMDDQIDELIANKLNTNLSFSQELLNQEYPGDWSVKDGILYKGEYQVDKEFPFVEKMAEITGNTVQLYFGAEQLAACKAHVESHQKIKKIDQQLLGQIQKIEKAKVIPSPGHKGSQAGVFTFRDSSGETLGFFVIKLADDAYNHITNTVQMKLMVGSYVAMIITSIVFFFLTKIISRPIPIIVDGMTAAEKGDLTVNLDIDTDDEFALLGDKFNSMIKNLADLTRSVVNVADQVAGSADLLNAGAGESSKTTEQIAATIQMVATGTEDQAKSIEQTSTTINEMTTGIQEVASHAQDVLAAANEANAMAAEGGRAVGKAIQQMLSVNKTVNSTARTIRTLGERSQKIGYIVDVITGIAKQTNTLALNAAIEAARAGEHGRGFAVVAEEVRKLSEQSQDAARQIADLIMEIQVETGQAGETMEVGIQEVVYGSEAVNGAGDAFNEIISTVNKVARQIQEVSVATEEMAAGAEQAVAAVQNVASISEETAASAQQVAAAAEEQTASIQEVAASANVLAQLADELRSLVRHFKVD